MLGICKKGLRECMVLRDRPTPVGVCWEMVQKRKRTEGHNNHDMLFCWEKTWHIQWNSIWKLVNQPLNLWGIPPWVWMDCAQWDDSEVCPLGSTRTQEWCWQTFLDLPSGFQQTVRWKHWILPLCRQGKHLLTCMKITALFSWKVLNFYFSRLIK